MKCRLLLSATMALTLACGLEALHAGGEDKAHAVGKELPPWQRSLKGADARGGADFERQSEKAWEGADFAGALKAAEAEATLREKLQGPDHWQAVSVRWEVRAIRQILKQDADLQKQIAGIFTLHRQA